MDADEEIFFYDGKDEVIVWLTLYNFVTITCPMEFKMYPFDQQFCRFLMISNYPSNQIEHVSRTIYNETKQVKRDFFVKVTPCEFDIQWTVDGSTPSEDDTFRYVGFELTLTRNYWSYIWTYYIPVFIMVLVASISFWIPPDSVPGRITLLVTLALTLMSLFTSSQVLNT